MLYREQHYPSVIDEERHARMLRWFECRVVNWPLVLSGGVECPIHNSLELFMVGYSMSCVLLVSLCYFPTYLCIDM